ncbi:unnamed protein product [Protopolystoma xenopodis]|uniref:Uncharacterized protein n=1 Tax=Protopolystoma xenopodis TaxID=117903 RepID=A0A3S5AX77_9PLAT|nr:unnamed protein product [Protopolystoma xenopodis]
MLLSYNQSFRFSQFTTSHTSTDFSSLVAEIEALRRENSVLQGRLADLTCFTLAEEASTTIATTSSLMTTSTTMATAVTAAIKIASIAESNYDNFLPKSAGVLRSGNETCRRTSDSYSARHIPQQNGQVFNNLRPALSP